ncbi:MAG TPA: DUF3362 domain-containing protein [Gemmataceae bacterium]|nr:DUF3362 domain-containing protein [Gemmataceae bacterium]
MYYTGIDPFTKQEAFVARHLRDCKLQRALFPFFKPENYFEVRKALEAAGRTDLIGGDGRRMRRLAAIITMRWQIRHAAKRSASGVCRSRAIDPGGSRRTAKTRSASRRAAVPARAFSHNSAAGQ